MTNIVLPRTGGWFLLSIKDAARSGQLADLPLACLPVMAVIASHTDKHGSAYPSQARIARFGGITKSSVGPALKALSSSRWIQIKEMGRGHLYAVTPGTWRDSVCIWRWIIVNRTWAKLTSSAKTLYIVLQSLSRPGDGSQDLEEDWDAVVEENITPDGCRHVRPKDARPADLSRLCGIAARTVRKAMSILINDVGLVIRTENGLLLPNTLGFRPPSEEA